MSKINKTLKSDTIENDVMRKIMEGTVSMKPRWYFVVGSLLMSAGLLGMSILAIFLLNISFFAIRSHGPRAGWRLQIMLETFPWYIPVFAVVALVAGLWLLKKYDFSYKHNFKAVAAGFVIILIAAGILIDTTGINEYWFGQNRMLRLNQAQRVNQQVQPPVSPRADASSLDTQTIESLHLALADERKALTTYQAAVEKFGPVKPFVNIIRAEQQHISMLETLFNTYDVEIPQDTTVAPQLPDSLKEACQVGVDAEIANDELYQKMIGTIQQDDIRATFSTLAQVSRENHLPAFERCSE